jgi:hypothetical protein
MTSGSCGIGWRTLLVVLVMTGLGCNDRPRAPALEDSAVYQNEREGFRFLVPEGWTQQAKSMVPPGKLDHELILVVYRRYTVNPPATLQVSIQDPPEEANLAQLLIEARSEDTNWKLVRPPAEARVGNRTGKHLVFQGKSPLGRMDREVIAVRRGARVLFFTATFGPGDHASRDLMQQTFANVVWK